MRPINPRTAAGLLCVAAVISFSVVSGCKSSTTAACKPGTVLVKVTCPVGSMGGELKVSVSDNQRVTEELSVGTCGGERSAFLAEFAFDDLKAVGALSATVKLVEGAAVLASASSSPQSLDGQECLVLEPEWPSGTDDGGAIPIGGNGGSGAGGFGGSDDGDAGIGGAIDAGVLAPPPECQASDPPRSCLGVAGNCAKGTESCVGGKWGVCSVKKAGKDSCDVVGDDADCDGAPNKGCSCLPGEPVVCGPPAEQGICKKGKQSCINGTLGSCADAVYAKPRDCTSAGDNDCDGKLDNVLDGICQCSVGASQACQPPEPAGTTCKPNTGTQACVANAEKTASAWSPCSGGVCELQCVPSCAAHQVCQAGKCSPSELGAFTLPGATVAGLVAGIEGEILLWGWTESSVDLDPGPGSYVVNGSTSLRVYFYAAYDKNGAFLWFRALSGGSLAAAAPWGTGFLLAFTVAAGQTLDLGNGIVFSKQGGVLAALSKGGVPSEVLSVSGQWNPLSLVTSGSSAWAFSSFEGQLTLGTGGPVRTSSNGADYLLFRLDANAGVKWASVLDVVAGSGFWAGNAIVPLPAGRVFLAHPIWFTSVDLDPGSGAKVVGAVSAESAFAAAYGADGALEFGGELRGKGLVNPKTALNSDAGGVTLGGEIYGDLLGEAWVDVDISSAERRISGVKNYDVWIARYGADGTIASSARVAAEGQVTLYGIVPGPRGFRLFSGFDGTAVLDDGIATSQVMSSLGSSVMVELSPVMKVVSSFKLEGVVGQVAAYSSGFVITTNKTEMGKPSAVVSRYRGGM